MVIFEAMKSLLTLTIVVCAAQIAAAIETSDLEETMHLKLDRGTFFKRKNTNCIYRSVKICKFDPPKVDEGFNENKKGVALRGGETEYALYGYDGGPGTSNWDGICANGRSQSPIDFKPDDARPVFRRVLRFNGANQTPISTNITNSGHSIKIKLRTARPIQVSGGPFGDNTYEFQQMHFHWGKYENEGSEHTLTVRRFPLEGHAVFYKVGFRDPTAEKDGIAVLGVHYEHSTKDNPVLETVTKSVAQITLPNQFIVRPGGNTLLDYLPRNLDSYFNYVGSLTTPPCTEGVHWIVFTERLSVSEQQVSQFRKMKDELGYNVIYNFRETQPLNGRTVNLVKASERVVN